MRRPSPSGSACRSAPSTWCSTRCSRPTRVLEGDIRPGGTEREWCDPEVLRRLKRRTLAALRRRSRPSSAESTRGSSPAGTASAADRGASGGCARWSRSSRAGDPGLGARGGGPPGADPRLRPGPRQLGADGRGRVGRARARSAPATGASRSCRRDRDQLLAATRPSRRGAARRSAPPRRVRAPHRPAGARSSSPSRSAPTRRSPPSRPRCGISCGPARDERHVPAAAEPPRRAQDRSPGTPSGSAAGGRAVRDLLGGPAVGHRARVGPRGDVARALRHRVRGGRARRGAAGRVLGGLPGVPGDGGRRQRPARLVRRRLEGAQFAGPVRSTASGRAG